MSNKTLSLFILMATLGSYHHAMWATETSTTNTTAMTPVATTPPITPTPSTTETAAASTPENNHLEHEEHDAHEHGVATLSIGINTKQVELVLDSPLANIVGFEHAPTTPEEQAAIQAVKKTLEQTTKLFTFSAQADCQHTHTTINSSVFLDTLTQQIPETEKAANPAHNDVEVTWTYECQQPEALKTAEIKLFSAFPKGIQHLKVEWVTDKGQASAQELTQDSQLQLAP